MVFTNIKTALLKAGGKFAIAWAELFQENRKKSEKNLDDISM